jgi:hypothetical protein
VIRLACDDPFDADSFWKRGLPVDQSGMAFQDDPSIRTAGAWVNTGAYSQYIAKATAADPLATVTDIGHGGEKFQCRIPASVQIPSGTDAHLEVIQPDGRYCYELFGAAKQSSGAYTCQRRAVVDLWGKGEGPANGVRANGTPAVGGVIRAWEINPADPRYTGSIDHAIAFALPATLLYMNAAQYTADGSTAGYYGSGVTDAPRQPGHLVGKSRAGFMRQPGYVWPATEQDWDSPTSYSGTIPMGSLWTIPASVNIAAIIMRNGQLLPPQAVMLAKAIQDYGAYVIDRAGDIAFVTEAATAGSPTQAWTDVLIGAAGGAYDRRPVNAIRDQLRRVINSTEATPGGAAPSAPRRGVRAAPFA